MKKLRDHPVWLTLTALALAAGAAVGIILAYGPSEFARAWRHLQPGWIALAAVAQLLTLPAYALGYRWAARSGDRRPLPMGLVARTLISGFAPFAPQGGFALDKRVLTAAHGKEKRSRARVLGLAALEWTLLAPAACFSAIGLLIVSDHRAMPSLLWPWALAVPIGFALGFWLAEPSRCSRVADGGSIRQAVGGMLRGVRLVRELAVSLPECWSAWLGMALYWALDIASFYGAIRTLDLRPNLGEVILAYATGYALTRRSLPLAGAGATEALMTFALHWVGQPVLASLAAVLVYRAFNLGLPAVAGLLVRDPVAPLLDAADEHRRPADHHLRRAKSPPLPLG